MTDSCFDVEARYTNHKLRNSVELSLNPKYLIIKPYMRVRSINVRNYVLLRQNKN